MIFGLFIDIISKKEGYYMSIDAYAEAWAHLKGQKINRLLGFGQFGKAYLADNGRVYKITRDDCEALASAILKENPNDLFVEIYDVKKTGGDFYIIEQEFTEHTSEADALFWEMMSASDRIGSEGICEMLIDHASEMECILDKDSLLAAKQLLEAREHCRSFGVIGDGIDLASDNYSYIDKKIKLFDCRDNGLSKNEAKLSLAQRYPEVFQVNNYDLETVCNYS